MTNSVSRLAPSPTGALHLGNARTFLVNSALARNHDWTLLMRLEDLDGPRNKPGAGEESLDVLAWLGIDFDGALLRQSEDLEPYRSAMRRLVADRRVYSCDLTRRDIAQAASAPHRGDQEPHYPAAWRPTEADRYRFDRTDTNYRFLVDPVSITIRDEVLGASVHRPHEEIGDFVIWTKGGAPAYQLAVVVDDARQSVTDVVRGEDLLPSAARQELLYAALGVSPPRWWHLPLVVGPDGRRLAKRHGDTRVAAYRQSGVPASRIVGLIAWWCGSVGRREEMSAEEFRAALDLSRLPRDPVTFTQDDHRWLLGNL